YMYWANDYETAVDADSQPLTEFRNYGPVISPRPWDEKVIFAGIETSTECGGHVDGVLSSAEGAVIEVLWSLLKCGVTIEGCLCGLCTLYFYSDLLVFIICSINKYFVRGESDEKVIFIVIWRYYCWNYYFCLRK